MKLVALVLAIVFFFTGKITGYELALFICLCMSITINGRKF